MEKKELTEGERHIPLTNKLGSAQVRKRIGLGTRVDQHEELLPSSYKTDAMLYLQVRLLSAQSASRSRHTLSAAFGTTRIISSNAALRDFPMEQQIAAEHFCYENLPVAAPQTLSGSTTLELLVSAGIPLPR